MSNTQASQSETDLIFVFTDLLLVYPILNKSYTCSLTVQQLSKLGVANIAAQIGRYSNQFAGRLTLFLNNLKKICTDRWVLDAVQGYQIEFLEPPHQHHPPMPHHFPRKEMESLER